MTDEKAIRHDYLQVIKLGFTWYFTEEKKEAIVAKAPMDVVFNARLSEGVISAHVVDVTTLTCPEPLMMLRQALRQEESGTYCLVFATDPSTQRDFKSFCQFTGHGFLAMTENELSSWQLGTVYSFLLRKK